MKQVSFVVSCVLMTIIFTSCDQSLTMKRSPILYHRAYNFWVDKTDVNRGGFRMYSLEKDTFFVLTNDVHCVSNDVLELSNEFHSSFRFYKAPLSRTAYFILDRDTAEINFDLSEKNGVQALWSAPCEE